MNRDALEALAYAIAHLNENPEENKIFKKEPKANIIQKEDFQERTRKVFELLCKALAKSFGPYGAPTLIYNYPDSHVTKDGYTIMKNLSMDAQYTLLDEAIRDMVASICGRLNYTVGDGTTSAVIATNSIYQSYMHYFADLTLLNIMSRDVIKKYNLIKGDVIKELHDYVIPIRTDNAEKLRQNIYDVVYVSSNGDEELTNYIADLYAELKCPAITSVISPDGITRSKLITGYKYNLVMADKLYINSDNQTMELSEADVLIFTTVITADIYNNIIKPMNEVSRARGRKLIIAAQRYDETTLNQVIARDLRDEYDKLKDINLVITVYSAMSAYHRKLVEDFAVLCNTRTIDTKLALSMVDEVKKGATVDSLFSIDDRNIEGLTQAVVQMTEEGSYRGKLYHYGMEEKPVGYEDIGHVSNAIRLGYARDCSLGLKQSIFGKFFYDEDMYQKILADAYDTMRETEERYSKLGTFNLEVGNAQTRYYSLNLKMGIIEVGADSELSKGMVMDAVDDAIKAAASAFDHGVIKGCNTNLIMSINNACEKVKEDDKATKLLYKILQKGFMDVYKTVLNNGYKNSTIYHLDNYDDNLENTRSALMAFLADSNIFDDCEELFEDQNALDYAIDKCIKDEDNNNTVTLFDIIVRYSIETGKVFDLTTRKFSDNVINSTETDEQILKATIDLISLLITGNQVIVTQKHNF